ncbi:MAG: hypothetical protein DIU60_006165 [Actinomycetes bacterium]
MPAFVLAVAAAFGVYATIPTVYVSNAVLVLTTPTGGGVVPPDPRIPMPRINPMLNFEHGLSVSASILIAALGTPETARELGVREGGDTEYQVTNGSSNLESLATGPLVFVEASSTDPRKATAMVRRVIARAHVELAARQAAVAAPKGTYITMYEAVPPTAPQPHQGRRLRATAAALALGLFASLAATFAVESLATHRRARRRPVAPAREPGGSGPSGARPAGDAEPVTAGAPSRAGGEA